MDKVCSFFGHRKIEKSEALQEKLAILVESLIKREFTVFFFGGFGEFDELCYRVVSLLRQKYPHIKRIYCVSGEKQLQERKRLRYFPLEEYEDFIYLPPSFDYWYTRIYYRNCAMIDTSDAVIFYAEERENSGAYKAYKYAKCKKDKYIVNLWRMV